MAKASRKIVSLMCLALLLCCMPMTVLGEVDPHGLEPADDMPYIPDLGGLRHQTFKNQYGDVRHLSEGVVLRRSSVEDGKATVPAGGLYYISEVAEEARPLRRDPFFILGEQGYLLKYKTSTREIKDITIKRGEKNLVDKDGYRLWFDYSTDHYQKPYAQLALISPAGHWPGEFPVSTHFAEMDEILKKNFKNGVNPQIWNFYMDPTYEYGATVYKSRKVEFDDMEFESIHYPIIDEAMFSFSRPWVLEVRQEDFRWYGNKRIYAFRKPSGFLVRVTDWSGSKVLGEKLVRPATPQGYKDRMEFQDDYSLTLPEYDMHIEISIDPEFMTNSDFSPATSAMPYGWPEGVLSFLVYDNLINVKKGEAWPLDNRYTVGLEANLLTGGLQRLVLENAEPFTLTNDNDSMTGPVKFSHFWNRPYFKVVANGFEGETVRNYYLRDRFFQRTDNLAFNKEKGRTRDIDFFVGRVPTLVPILEDTFLMRLADNTYDTMVEGSHFTSYPRVITEAAFYPPDLTAPFEPRLKGFMRRASRNFRRERVLSAEGMVIRGSYVDYDKGQIVIPPSGLYYTSRNARNVRSLTGENFYFLGKKAWLVSFESATIVKKNINLDFWRKQPTGQMNPIFWQDEPLGHNNKVLRFTQNTFLDDRPMGKINIVKYSGNTFGTPFYISPEFEGADSRYHVPSLFAEGSTWTVPDFIGPNYLRMAEIGTPIMKKFYFTYKKPKKVALAEGESAKLGTYTLTVDNVDAENTSVTVTLADKSGKTIATKTLGSVKELWEILPQHQEAVKKLQLMHGDVLAEIDIDKPTKKGKANLHLYTHVQSYSVDQPLKEDERFIVRPDVCGHCYQLNEVLIDNAKPIILDKDNPVFEGFTKADGNPMFRIVIDSPHE